MPRVTRSKKIEVAEDHTASPIVPQDQLPDDVAQLSSLSETTSTNAMQDSITAELKGLKAAYRSAVGGGRKGGRRGKKPKKDNQDAGAESGDGQDESQGMNPAAAINSVPEATHRTLQGRQVEGMTNINGEIQVSAPIARTTRRKAAQVGQYGISHFESIQGRSFNRICGRAAADRLIAVEDALPKSCETLNNNINRKRDLYHVTPEQSNNSNGIPLIEAIAQYTSSTPPSKSPSRSPAKTLAEVEAGLKSEDFGDLRKDTEEDSFIEQITARSPAKHISRIEDSVEALDQFEEAIEALDQAALTEKVMSPEKTRRKAANPKTPTFRMPLDSKAFMDKRKSECDLKPKTKPQDAKAPLSSKPSSASVRVRPTVPRASVVRKAMSMVFKPDPSDLKSKDAKAVAQSGPVISTGKRPVSMIDNSGGMDATRTTTLRRPVSCLPPKEIVKSTKPVTKSSFELPGEAVSRKLKEQREARLALRESSEESFHTARVNSVPRIKSTKPPTTSNFELPGEAVSRRKREANEARLRAQEEEERKRREFKAKPLRKSTVPSVVPRDTVASRARLSKVGLENVIGNGGGTLGRMSNIGAHRPSLCQLVSANISAPRAPGPAPQLSPQPSSSAHSAGQLRGSMQRTVSAEEVMVQRQRAKEIYNRDVRLTGDIERERREREAAAKRAREEAAERGRQASREWAEKQMAKKLAVQDKGTRTGYGPGGQMGLKT